MPYFYLTFLMVLLDQAVKYVVNSRMAPFQSIPVWGNLFAITHVRNYGAAFGILQSQTLILITLSLGVIILIWRNRRHLYEYPALFQVGIACALGGAVGNLIDRVRLGYVIDFIDFRFWPVFNIADIAIVIGVVLLIWGLIKQSPGSGQLENDSNSESPKEEIT